MAFTGAAIFLGTAISLLLVFVWALAARRRMPSRLVIDHEGIRVLNPGGRNRDPPARLTPQPHHSAACFHVSACVFGFALRR
jgi:hypothetical protein